MKYTLLVVALLTNLLAVTAQKKPLDYYLPAITYDAKVPTPEAFLGFQIGEWHVSHDQSVAYMRKLAEVSPRVKLTEYARSYEARPLVYLTITSTQNQQQLEQIKAQRRALLDPRNNDNTDPSKIPAVIYQGFSIHGNEPSGGNAALLVAYYLAAGQSPEIEQLLQETVIIFDPCFNPDGFHRFATWANQHKNAQLIGDPQDREYNEVWPGGRFNHYWFDLNRDWLTGAHPESIGRIKLFHEWKPNILTDHHEMGTNSSFFFMPGVPSRVNPITPKRNQELTGKIGEFHARNLDKIGSLYYTKEGYDDFYYGKGSTFPDANGCIGILFEQASSRGHLQESANGLLSFPFTIRNQVQTAFSTQQAAVALRQELLSFQREFYREALAEGKNDARGAFVFGDAYDPARVDQFIEVLRRQDIEVHALGSRLNLDGKNYEPGTHFVVPLEQPQYRLIRGIFEGSTTFEDSIFYDISAWALPYAFNLPAVAVGKKNLGGNLLGPKVSGLRPSRPAFALPVANSYAYLFEWDNYYAPRLLFQLQNKGLRTKVAMEPFVLNGKNYAQGTILIPAQNQDATAEQIHQWVVEGVRTWQIPVDGVSTGLTPTGIDLGSNGFVALRQPKVLLVVGEGTAASPIGEVWHLLDQRMGMPVSKVEADDFARINLSRYTHVVMADGFFNTLSPPGMEKLRDWTNGGGVVVGFQRAISTLRLNGLGAAQVRSAKPSENKMTRRPYGSWDEDFGSSEIPGTIFEAELDLSHPLAFGYRTSKLALFRDNDLFLEPTQNPYATPVVYTAKPLLAGYLNRSGAALAPQAAGIVVSRSGSGRVIFFADNPNFRAHWWGTNKLFLNALFFGSTINLATTEVETKKP